MDYVSFTVWRGREQGSSVIYTRDYSSTLSPDWRQICEYVCRVYNSYQCHAQGDAENGTCVRFYIRGYVLVTVGHGTRWKYVADMLIDNDTIQRRSDSVRGYVTLADQETIVDSKWRKIPNRLRKQPDFCVCPLNKNTKKYIYVL